MLLNEECVVISGLLVGLNVIDCNFDLKGEDLDVPVSILVFISSRSRISSFGQKPPIEIK